MSKHKLVRVNCCVSAGGERDVAHSRHVLVANDMRCNNVGLTILLPNSALIFQACISC